MALGSSAYPNLCAAGKTMDMLFHGLGAKRLCRLQLGDEINNQAESVNTWQASTLVPISTTLSLVYFPLDVE